MQFEQDILIIEDDINLLDNFGYHKNEKPILKESNIEKDNIDLIKKSFDTKNYVKNLLLGRTTQDRLSGSELLLSQRD